MHAQIAESFLERKPILLAGVNFFPMRGNRRTGGIAVPKQQLQLMDIERAQNAIRIFRPPTKAAFR
jgi:hypothetical protein